MIEEILRSLRECVFHADRLRKQLFLDEEAISSCINGTIMLEYKKNYAKVLEMTDEMIRSVQMLQTELLEMQMLGL